MREWRTQKIIKSSALDFYFIRLEKSIISYTFAFAKMIAKVWR